MDDTAITQRLAKWAVEIKSDDIPAAVRSEGVRTFVNWLGCAAAAPRMRRSIARSTPYACSQAPPAPR